MDDFQVVEDGDLVPDDVEVDPTSTVCEVCGDELPTLHGKKIHLSRMHGIKAKSTSAAKQAKATEPTRGAGGKRPQLLNPSKKFTGKSRELTTDLAAAGVAWLAVQWIEKQGVPVLRNDREQFLIPDSDRGMMFRPFMDGLEQFSPAVQLINSICERWDYIQCLLLWKAYMSTIREFAESRKVDDDGTSRQSVEQAPSPERNGGNGFARAVPFSAADFS